MKYSLSMAGFEGQNIEIETSFFTRPKLLRNGVGVPLDRDTHYMFLQRNDGTQAKCNLKQQGLGLDVPALVVDGKIYRAVKPLSWWVWIWCAIPILLFFFGGAIGVFIGFIGLVVNVLIFRSGLNLAGKLFITLLVTLSAFGVCFWIFGMTLHFLGQ